MAPEYGFLQGTVIKELKRLILFQSKTALGKTLFPVRDFGGILDRVREFLVDENVPRLPLCQQQADICSEPVVRMPKAQRYHQAVDSQIRAVPQQVFRDCIEKLFLCTSLVSVLLVTVLAVPIGHVNGRSLDKRGCSMVFFPPCTHDIRSVGEVPRGPVPRRQWPHGGGTISEDGGNT